MYRDNFKEEQEDIKLLVSRYEEMLTNEGIGFFEKKQFTQLINYYEARDKTKQALYVIENALEQHPFSATFYIRKAQFLIDANKEPEALDLLEQAEIYHFPLDKIAQENLNEYFDKLTPESFETATSIEIEGRSIGVMKKAEGVIMIEFLSLCDGPRSQTDYIEISREYQTVLLANVQQMDESKDDIARRFIAMVDEFYDHNIKLVISAAVPVISLYSDGRLQFEFERTKSRLQEMQSHDYLASAHKA